jgi:two-component system sensor histidine kinase UhpB
MKRFRRLGRLRRLTLVERTLLATTAVLTLILALLIVTPVTVSAPIRIGELAVLLVAFVALLALNVVYVRQALAPLSRLAAKMKNVDLARQGSLEIDRSDDVPELRAFAGAFSEMLARLREERRAGARAALTAQERERRRIAQALHDEAGQTLTAVALEIERTARRGSGEERDRMTALASQLHETLDEIRRIARELRPEALDDLGLVNALIALSSRVAKQGGVSVERRLSGALPEMSEEVELVVYRVAQEALTNVLRHAEATTCRLELEREGGWLRLRVVDDGRGMPGELGPEGIGIEGMRERALLAGGALSIGAAPGGGTEVELAIPLAD